ncbi:MAG: hypothetical protein EON52_15230 [Actinomycetales bacterium]|nr:MAG: hypothetical protein EON52_15230 [Actinomycetales bacterium]
MKDYIATKTLPVAAAGQPYSFVLRTNGNVAGTWTSLGGLPGGISLDGARLSGTPQAGTSTTLFLTFTPRQPYAAADTRLVYTVEGTMPSTRSSTVVDAGSQFACRVKSEDASLWCWGYNLSGNLGIGDYSPMDAVQPTPQKVPGAWRTVATGGFFGACGLRTDDSLWCWGQSNQGQIGDGSLVGANSPRQVTSGGKTWSSVAVGYSHACATTKPGALWCWGDNSSGALGLPAAGNGSSTPVLVDQSTWTAVSAGNNQTCGVKTDGSLWCWGQGDRTPVKVDSATWSDVTIGLGSICGVRTDGTLWCWGSNRSGQLGNGTAQSSLLPVRIDPTSTWSSVAVGDAFVCGVKNDGTQRCWGSGDSGQLGAGAPRRSDVPITVQ